MKYIIITISSFLLGGCASVVAEQIKPDIYVDNVTGLATSIITNYDSVVLDYDLTLRNGSNIHFSDCLKVDATHDTDIVESEYHLLRMIRANCKALALYTNAESAYKSHLQEILTEHTVAHLPATAYPYVNEYDKNLRKGKTLKQFHADFKEKKAFEGVIDVETNTKRLSYSVLATGDFDDDRVEDALILISWHSKEAFGKGFKLIKVSRPTSEARFSTTELD
ncbi:hypothetical protein EXT46_04535 [Pseudoalteromonas sp. CO325X]|uniref:hypothetical protein n=1 Tax=Pseudoalteromonas sp. CO325X TaxID=1777262 RepID=UPI001023CAAC|nr:hypothetical protein [Pseudoalteromonas sp. CO325X]RZF84052.1 hypothetical protein EXT46_04535 [Pseudoalteromonas sp. CO325X]